MIRAATTADLPKVLEMCGRFYQASPYAKFFAFSPASMVLLAERVVDPAVLNSHALIAEENGEIVGMMGLLLFDHPWSGERMASELCWWVNPEARTSLTGPKMLRAAEAWAKSMGAVAIHMIAPSTHVGEFYTAMGFTAVETTFQRRF